VLESETVLSNCRISTVANPDPAVGLAERYTMRHCNFPLDLIS